MKRLYMIIFLFLFFFPFDCYCLQYPELNSNSVVVFDRNDNNILYSYNNESIKSIASLTKIVTTIVAIEKIDNLDDNIIITSDIINSVDPIASKAGLREGDIVTYRDLLYASILPSGADATNALAITTSGSIDAFVDEMNIFVEKLNLNNTHFVNVTGLDADGHYSSANDVLKILNYSLDNSLFYKIFTTKEYTLTNGLIVKSTLFKYNGDDVFQIIGSKTGFTGDAGYCIATLSRVDNHDIIIILLDAEYLDGLYYNVVDSINLINFVNKNYSNVLLIKEDDYITKLPVELSNINEFIIKASNDIYKFLPSDYDPNLFRYEYVGVKTLSYKNKLNDKLGTILYYYGDEIIFEEDVFLSYDLKINYMKILKKFFVYEIITIILIVLFVFYIIRRKKYGNRRKNKEVSY